MSKFDQITALKIAGENVSLAHVVRSLQLSGKTQLLAELARDLIIQDAISKRGLTVSDEELQTAADNFRRDQKLERAVDTHNWLKDRGWSVEHLELHLERQLLHEKLHSAGIISLQWGQMLLHSPRLQFLFLWKISGKS